MSVPQTLLLGLVGSFVGGLLGGIFTSKPIDFSTAGLFGSIIGAVVALFVWRRVQARN